jgi:hypothetical protein
MSAIVTAPSSATAPEDARGRVLVSGSYGGVYNAWHAVRKGAKAVILNDAGVGKNVAGVSGLAWLDRLGIPGAAADCHTCHIGDGDHMLACGVVSFVNERARALGGAVGQRVAQCAALFDLAPIVAVDPPPIAGGKRYVISADPGERIVLGLDAAPLLAAGDAGAIAVTGSHAALFRGQPDNVVSVDVFAAFFNDAGVGLDEAGVARLPDLDRRGIIAATVSADSAEIGRALSAYESGVISYVNATARQRGIAAGERLRDVVARLRST